jgi:hypothetical protein
MVDFNSELRGKHVLLYLEDDATPGTFAQSCLFGESMDHASDVQYDEWETRDCTNPDAPAVKRRTVKSITDTFTGTGHLKNSDEVKRMDDWHYGQTNKNVEIRLHIPNADGTIGALFATYAGSAKLTKGSTSYSPTGPIIRNATLNIDGALTRTYETLT